MSTDHLPELPEPNIRVTEDEVVYCADVPKDKVPPHDDFWDVYQLRAYGQQCYEAGVARERERAAKAWEADHGFDKFGVAAAIRMG